MGNGKQLTKFPLMATRGRAEAAKTAKDQGGPQGTIANKEPSYFQKADRGPHRVFTLLLLISK